MRNIFHRSSEFVAKHKHHHHLFLAVLALAVAGTGAYTFRHEIARAATYTFTQASWAGGAQADTASHTSNQTGWTKYSSASSTISVGANDISLLSASYSFTDGVTPSTTSPDAGGGDFDSGNFGTPVTTTLTGGGVGLLSSTNNLYTLSPTLDRVTKITPAGSASTITTGDNPIAITVDPSNNVFTANQTANTVTKILPDGTPSLFATIQTSTSGIVASSSGYIYTISPNKITIITPAGSTSTITATGISANPIFDTAGNIYTTYYSTETLNGGVRKTTPAGSTTEFGSGYGGPLGHVFDNSGNLYVADNDSSVVRKVTPAGSASVFASLGVGVYPRRIAIDAVGNLYTANFPTTVSKITTGGTVSTYATLPTEGQELAIDTAGNLYAVNSTAGAIYKIPPGGGSNSVFVSGLASPQGLVFDKVFADSGTFTSATIDFARPTAFTSLSFASTTPAGAETFCTTGTGSGCAIKIQIATSANAGGPWNFKGPDGSSSTYFTSNTGGSTITTTDFNNARYLKYQAILSTANPNVTPTLGSVIINDTQYSTTGGTLTSSKYDAGDDTNLISKLTWTGSATSTTETIKFQMRSASSAVGLDSATWCGPTVCDGAEYFLYSNSGVTLASNHPLRSNGNDRWVQYKVFLTSGGAVTPFLTSVAVQYVVNAAPTFDATYGTNGITVSQVTDSGSADFGKVTISYRIRDIDTTTGTTNPGSIIPSFAYNSGAGWVNLTTNLSAGATDSKAVEEVNYNTYTATWTASSTVTANTASAQVRVTLNDNEAANSTGTATSANFILDTTAPTVSAGNATLDSSTGGSAVGTVNATTTDSSTIQYRLCNNSAFPGTDTQGNICTWTTLASSPINASASWIPTASPSGDEVVYMQVRDLYNNITSRTIVAPALPANFGYTDASNVGINVYREFLSWSPFVATTSSTFSSYRVYHSTDGVTYGSPLTTITDSAVNYYVHNITTATSSTHYYKVLATNTEGSVSNFTGVQSDIPDGSGGLDTTAPYIPLAGIASPTVGNSSANITFSTYTDSSMATGELATSTVFYGTYSGAVPGTCPASRVDTSSYVVNHSIYLTGLTSGTSYYYCVVAKDMTGNTSTASSATGGVFTTVSGPRITNVTQREITDTSALIFWNTDTSSDSKVCYSTTTSGANSCTTSKTEATVTTSGTNANGTFYQHQVGLTGLTPGLTYYYKVSSTDTASTPLTSTDNNNGQYYSFVTLTDTSPPVISATSTPVLAPDSAVVVWQTNEPATTRVDYGLTSGYGTISDDTSSNLSIYHVRALTSLTKETTYYYRVTSKDAANNTATADGTFYTPADGNVVISVSVRAGDTKDTTPPVISNVVVSDITPFGAVVKFSTDEDTDGFVKYGKETTYGDAAGDEVWAKTHTIRLRGLTLGTDYHIKVTANDKAGNTGTSADQIFKTTFLSENLKDMANIENIEQFQKEIESAIESILPSLVPPFITKPIISDITEGGAKISFKSNIKAFPVVVFAENGAYDETKENPYTGEVSDTTEKATSHELALTGLKGNTKYHVQARGFSLPKVIGKSADVTFITKASKIAGSIVERKKDSFTVVWTTEQPTTTIVEYKDLKRGITGRKTDDAKKTSHSMKIENLPSGTAYEVNLSGMTEQGNVAEAGSPLSVTTSTDVTPPAISGFKVDNALVPGRTDRIQTIVSWVTDEPSNSTAYYQEGAGAPGDTEELANKNEILDSYVTNHSVILPSLKPGTIYRLKVTSSDDSGNEGSFGPRTVITPKQTESITDIIFKNFEDSFKFLQKI